jgi:hypothetical protein
LFVRQSGPTPDADQAASVDDTRNERVAMTRLVRSRTTNTLLAKSEFHAVN